MHPSRLIAGVRDPSLVRDQYEEVWGTTLRGIQHHIAVASLINSYCQNIERVVELGSGWGVNLIALHSLAKNRRYIALEYTEAGREACRAISTFTSIPIEIHPFDYHYPSLSHLRSKEKTLIFTCHSIEQITYLNPHLFREILALSPNYVIHIEPVGWQLHDTETPIRARCFANGYNKDLIEHLIKLEATEKIKIHSVVENFTAVNLLNPSTAIVWVPQ